MKQTVKGKKSTQKVKRLNSPTLREYMLKYTSKKNKKYRNQENLPEKQPKLNELFSLRVLEFERLINTYIKEDNIRLKFRDKLHQIQNINAQIQKGEELLSARHLASRNPSQMGTHTGQNGNLLDLPYISRKFDINTTYGNNLLSMTNLKTKKSSNIDPEKKESILEIQNESIQENCFKINIRTQQGKQTPAMEYNFQTAENLDHFRILKGTKSYEDQKFLRSSLRHH